MCVCVGGGGGKLDARAAGSRGCGKAGERGRGGEILEENYGADDMIETGLGCAEGDKVNWDGNVTRMIRAALRLFVRLDASIL